MINHPLLFTDDSPRIVFISMLGVIMRGGRAILIAVITMIRVLFMLLFIIGYLISVKGIIFCHVIRIVSVGFPIFISMISFMYQMWVGQAPIFTIRAEIRAICAMVDVCIHDEVRMIREVKTCTR